MLAMWILFDGIRSRKMIILDYIFCFIIKRLPPCKLERWMIRQLVTWIRRQKMGMTIDEHIAQLKKLKSFHNGSYGASINFAIDTMRKYQKIQEIINIYDSTDISYKDTLQDIKEVLEDGNNNTNQNYNFDS